MNIKLYFFELYCCRLYSETHPGLPLLPSSVPSCRTDLSSGFALCDATIRYPAFEQGRGLPASVWFGCTAGNEQRCNEKVKREKGEGTAELPLKERLRLFSSLPPFFLSFLFFFLASRRPFASASHQHIVKPPDDSL